MEITSYDVLVIILSITLAIFLVMSIVALTYLIQIMKKAKIIAQKVEKAVDNVEAATKAFKTTASGSGVASFISNIVETVKNRGGKK